MASSVSPAALRLRNESLPSASTSSPATVQSPADPVMESPREVGGNEDWMQLDETKVTGAASGGGAAASEATVLLQSPQLSVNVSATSTAAPADQDKQSLRHTVVSHAQREMKKRVGQYSVKDTAYWQERVIRNRDFGALYIFCIGVSAPCGAIYTTWSNTLPASGTVGVLLAISAIALGFVALCCCLGEMSSAFPFAGGSFGFARALLGKLAGQVVGLAESLEWLLIGVGFISLVSQGFTTLFSTNPQLEGLWLLLLYGGSLFINLMGGYYLYVPFALNTVVSIAFLVVYQLGMICYGDWRANAGIAAGLTNADGRPETTWFINGFWGFVQSLPYAVFTLVGFEICPLIADEVRLPKQSIPRGMISSSMLVCGMAVITLFAAMSCPQLQYGDLASTAFPLTDGFALIFAGPQATGLGADPRITVLFPVFTQWAAFVTCNMAWGRQMFAMARSGLLPKWLSVTWSRRGTPAAALITGTVLSLSAALIVRYMGPAYTAAGNAVLFNIGITGCCINYLFQAASFVVLRLRYEALARPFRSPLGIPGALYVMAIFGLTLVGVAQYPYLGMSVLAFALWLAVGLLYYFAYARFHLLMSPEEYRSLFLLYSMQFIRQKQSKAIKGQRGSVGSSDRASVVDRRDSTTGSKRIDRCIQENSARAPAGSNAAPQNPLSPCPAPRILAWGETSKAAPPVAIKSGAAALDVPKG